MKIPNYSQSQRYSILILSLICILCTACEQNKLKIDISAIELKMDIKRFDKALFTSDTAQIATEQEQLKKDYPEFYKLYFFNMLGLPDTSNESVQHSIKEIISNSSFKGLVKDCDSVYPQLDQLNAQLEDAFKHYLHYFPEKKTPTVLTFIDEFAFSIVNGDSTLGIGLHMFLGKDYPYYAAFQYPQYISNRFTPDYIAPTALKGFAEAEFPANYTDKSFLNRIIYEGKLLYFLDAMFPEMDDSLKIGFSHQQLEWCKNYQADMWADFINSKLLYSTDAFKYNKYVEEAPFTAGFDKTAAPRIGTWTGWQIVRKYMEENPSITLASLMKDNDYKKILKLAKYKPKAE